MHFNFGLGVLLLVMCTGISATTSHSEESNVTTVVLIGCTGNLAKKYLWDILYDLYSDKRPSGRLEVIGAATQPEAAGTAKLNDIFSNFKCHSHLDKGIFVLLFCSCAVPPL